VKASIMSIFVLLFASCSMVSNTPIDMPTIFPHRNYVDSLDDYRTVNRMLKSTPTSGPIFSVEENLRGLA